MINLLPYEVKKQTKAARINTVLATYSFITIIAAVFISLACYTTNMLITNEASVRGVDITETKLTKISNAELILSQQTSFSSVLDSLTNSLPEGTAISSLTTSDDASGKLLTVKLTSITNNIDAVLQPNIQKLPIFKNYKLVSTSDLDSKSIYKYETVISLNINKGVN